MLKRIALALLIAAVVSVGALYVVTLPQRFTEADLPAHTPDAQKGAYVFNAAGCASCHAAPGVSDATAAKELPGGVEFRSPFGTFRAPNISPDKERGIGGWSALDLVNALKLGVSPEGRHYYPAFPYVSFQRMTFEDIIDLKAYLDTLPPVTTPSRPHDLPFPFNFGRGVRLWQLLYVDGKTFQPDPNASDEVNRGAYLVRGPAHCGECHSPRNVFGGILADRALAGAPAMVGAGWIPNITPDRTGIADWSENDIVELLTSGFTPEFNSVGGEMAKVVRETARLTEGDRKAIAAYLKSLQPVANAKPAATGGS